jgi:hypothetical protein
MPYLDTEKPGPEKWVEAPEKSRINEFPRTRIKNIRKIAR